MQEPEESMDAFCTQLRKLAATCDFTDTDREIKSQIISGCTSTRLRGRGLSDDLMLDNLLQQAISLELSDTSAQEMEGDSKPVNALRQHTGKASKVNKKQQDASRRTTKQQRQANSVDAAEVTGLTQMDGKAALHLEKNVLTATSTTTTGNSA